MIFYRPLDLIQIHLFYILNPKVGQLLDSYRSYLLKSIGLTEYELGQLGYKDVTIFRPGFLAGANRNELRLAESIFGAITGLVSYVYDGIQINVKTLGQAMVRLRLMKDYIYLLNCNVLG